MEPFTDLLPEDLPVGVCDADVSLLRIPCRARDRVPADAASIVLVLFPYYVGGFAYRNVSRYAMADDYHAVAGGMLRAFAGALEARFPQGRFVPFIDASPLHEVEAAARAGLGMRGRNGLLINPRYGTYCFIGEVFSTVRFAPTGPDGGVCPSCGSCLRACPGGALGEEGFRRGRCLSHLTQLKRLDPCQMLAVAQGGSVWGCDVCSDVCPFNRRAAFSPIGAFYRNICAVITDNNLGGCFPSRAWAYKGRSVVERNLYLINRRDLPGMEAMRFGNHHDATDATDGRV